MRKWRMESTPNDGTQRSTPAPAQITLALTRHSAHTPTVYRIATSDDVLALLPDGTKPCDEPA